MFWQKSIFLSSGIEMNLFIFNLGVEMGQLVIVMVFALTLIWIIKIKLIKTAG